MLSKLVTGGTTNIVARQGKYYGAHLLQIPSGVALTIHDTAATATFAESNQVDKIVGGVASGTLQPSVQVGMPNPNGVSLRDRLTTHLTATGTATIFYE